jgi:hypothetical protein
MAFNQEFSIGIISQGKNGSPERITEELSKVITGDTCPPIRVVKIAISLLHEGDKFLLGALGTLAPEEV